MRPLHARTRLDALAAENAALRERIAQLESALGAHFPAPIEWRLTKSEAAVFGCLMRRELASREAMAAALYGDGDWSVDPKIFDIFIHRIRRKLRPLGIVIDTYRSRGWCLSPETKRRVAAVIADRAAAFAPPVRSSSESLEVQP